MLEAEFLCGTQSFSLSSAGRGEGKSLEGHCSAVLVHWCSNSFLMILLILGLFDKP